MARDRNLTLFDIGPDIDGLNPCPACSSRRIKTMVQPAGSVHHASLKCHDCGHHRWLPKPRITSEETP